MHGDNDVESNGCTHQRNPIYNRLKRGRDNQDNSEHRAHYGETVAQHGTMVPEAFERQS